MLENPEGSPEAAERFYRKMQVHDDPPEPAGGSQFCPPLTKDDTMKSIDPWNREKCGAAVVGARETHGSDERPALAHLSFGTALELLRQGEALARRGWNGRGQFIELQVPDKQSKMTLPYFYIRTVDGGLVPWLASQTDLLAHDWCVVRSAGLALVYGYSEDIGPGVVVPASQGPTGPVPARAD
jgi:hypothetical protein